MCVREKRARGYVPAPGRKELTTSILFPFVPGEQSERENAMRWDQERERIKRRSWNNFDGDIFPG